MKIKKLYFSLLLVMCLITNLFVFRLQVFAEVSQDRIVVGHGGSFGVIGFNYSMHQKYFTIQDATGIPVSSVTGPVYYYTVDNTTFQSVNGGDLLMLILNRGVGLVLQPEKAAALIQGFFSEITGATSSGFIEGALYDSNDTFLGYALDNINGLYYSPSPVDANEITVPSEMTNNVYNYYEYYILENPETVPYFTFHGPDKTSILNNLSFSDTTIVNDFSDYLDANFGSVNVSLLHGANGYMPAMKYGNYYRCASFDDVCMVSSSTSSYDAFCVGHNISTNDFSYTSLLTSSSWGFECDVLDSNFEKYDDTTCTIFDTNGTTTGTMYRYFVVFGNQYGSMFFPFGKDVTIYRDMSTFNQVNVTKTYSPTTYITDSFNSYNTSNDNSISTSVNQITNSVSNNSSSYSSSSSSYYNYVDNGYVDNSSMITNTTTVINNYYNDDNGGGGGDNPSDPDSPLDWSDLIELLKNLLEAIGAVIVGIFEGLISMITQVLDAIGSIVSNLDGFTEFLSALFGFLPSPVPEVIAAGFSLCILCAVIKFLRG